MKPEPDDRILDEWFPVAEAATVAAGSWHPFTLFDQRYVLVCGADGSVFVTHDTCPHRGAQLTLGSFDGDRIRCPYHGWTFDSTGTCVHQPAHPDRTPAAGCSLEGLTTTEAHGLYWVCVGSAPRNLPRYDIHDANPGRTIWLGPKTLAATGPRIVENFLDMAHFPFVHADHLGQVPHTEVRDYDVEIDADGVRLTNCVFWQPNPGPTATEGGDVAYEYEVTHPYAAMLRKVPDEVDGGEAGGFSLLLVVAPESEARCRVWMATTVPDPDGDLTTFNDFNAVIFDQDIATVESQLPRRLPLDARAEQHQRADRGSLAYRRWLGERDIRYGTSRNGEEDQR